MAVKRSTSAGKTVRRVFPFTRFLGGLSCVFLSVAGSKVQLQLPFMRTPFGFSTFTDKKTLKVNYSLDLSFDNDDQEAQVLLAKINALDDIMVKTVASNSVEWLGKPLKEEGLREMLMRPTPHMSKKGEYAPTLKLKVAVEPKTDKIIPEAFNMQQQVVDIKSIEKQSKVMAIVEFNQVWFIDKKFGISVKLLQVRSLLLATNKRRQFVKQIVRLSAGPLAAFQDAPQVCLQAPRPPDHRG